MRKRLMLTVSAAVLTCIFAPVAHAWYPFSERYEEWQKDRPITMGAWHRALPPEHIKDRLARFEAAGLNQLCGPRDATFREAAEELGL